MIHGKLLRVIVIFTAAAGFTYVLWPVSIIMFAIIDAVIRNVLVPATLVYVVWVLIIVLMYAWQMKKRAKEIEAVP